jgi:hypothetical protein
VNHDPKLLFDVLSQLWSNYKGDSGGIYDIANLCSRYGADADMVSNHLRREGLIKDEVHTENGQVLCSISMKGIAHLDPAYVEDSIDKVLKAMGGVNSIFNVMDILKLDPKDFQLAFDLANEMQNRDLVKLLYAFQPGKVVNVEMTLEGVRRRARVAG